MQTIFNTPAPSFNIEEALNIIRKEYDLNGEIKELYSDRDQNFHIANKSKNFINGILDKVISEYKKSGKIKKVGRGLLE